MSIGAALRWIGIAGVAAIAFAAGATMPAWWPSGYGRPDAGVVPAGSAGFSAPYVDLGMQPWHSSVEFSTEFVNQAAQAVTIVAVKPSCDCTAIDTEAFVGHEINRGGRLNIKGRLDTGSQLGKRASEVTFLLNTGALHTVRVHFEVMGTYRLQPERVVFEQVRLDHDDDADAVQCALFSSRTAQITAEPAADVPWLEISRAERGDGVTELYFHVRKSHLLSGQNFGQVRIETNDPFRPVSLVAVLANAVSSLRPTPAHVFLRRTESKRVRFLNEDGTPAVPAVATTADEGLVIQIEDGGRCVQISCESGEAR